MSEVNAVRTSFDAERAADFRQRFLRAVKVAVNAYDLYLIFLLLVQSSRPTDDGTVDNPFILFLVLVLLTLGFGC